MSTQRESREEVYTSSRRERSSQNNQTIRYISAAQHYSEANKPGTEGYQPTARRDLPKDACFRGRDAILTDSL
jgi:hypothetical protein